MRGTKLLCLALSAAIPLCACSSKDAEKEAPRMASVSEDTLAAKIADAPGLSIIASEVEDDGLAPIFDGIASYTLLAPRDPAFGKLGRAGGLLQQDDQRPAMMAILRDHILPGYFSLEDVRNAIEKAGGKPVTMRTMGGHYVSFTKQGETIFVTAEDGTKAEISGPAILASNGVILPIDTVLKDMSPND